MGRVKKVETSDYLLSENELPTAWYNIQADLPRPVPPPLHPGTGRPIGPADLAPLYRARRLERYLGTPA
jgi:tryptophan synthase beta chain